jgi:5-methylcytosine-specific restriction endonuclease McrA
MWSLPVPSVAGAMDDLTVAVTRADGTPLYAMSAAERVDIEQLYTDYDNQLGRPSAAMAGPALTNSLKTVIRNAYDLTQQKRRLKHVRAALMVAADRCPYCGITAVSDLDHHLPKSAYAALAIYPRNLVPSCHECNKIKHAAAPSLHAYHVEVPLHEPFFRAAAGMVGDALVVDFRIEQTPAMTNDVRDRATQQLMNLQLNRRYEAEINELVMSLRVALANAYGDDEDPGRVSEFLIRTAGDYERHSGVNHWKPVALRALAASLPFCDGGFNVVAGVP